MTPTQNETELPGKASTFKTFKYCDFRTPPAAMIQGEEAGTDSRQCSCPNSHSSLSMEKGYYRTGQIQHSQDFGCSPKRKRKAEDSCLTPTFQFSHTLVYTRHRVSRECGKYNFHICPQKGDEMEMHCEMG